MFRGDIVERLDDYLAGLFVDDIFATVVATDQVVVYYYLYIRSEEAEDLPSLGQAHSLEQEGDRQLPTPVDVDIHDIVDVHAEFQPGTFVRQNASGKQPLAIRMHGLVKEHAWRAMQLADYHSFGAVDDKSALVRHQREFTEENRLFDDIFDRTIGTLLVPRDETERGAQRSGKSHTPLPALLLAITRVSDRVIHVF